MTLLVARVLSTYLCKFVGRTALLIMYLDFLSFSSTVLDVVNVPFVFEKKMTCAKAESLFRSLIHALKIIGTRIIKSMCQI